MRIHRRFRPCNLNGCVLYLPFYVYGGNAQKTWDVSGSGNHGTISQAVPGSYPMLSGAELVTNGTFTGDASWTKGTGWAITTVATKTAGVASDLEQDIGAVAGVRYYLVYTITRNAGSITPQIGGTDGTARSAAGTYAEEIVAASTANLKFQADASFAGTVDNVSARKVTGYQGLGWYFDGSNDYIDCGLSSSFAFGTGDMSILAWHRLPTALSAEDMLLGNYTAAGGFYLRTITAYAYYLIFSDGTVTEGAVTEGLVTYPTLDKWCLIGVSIDRNVEAVGYFNGTYSATLDITSRTGSIDGDGSLYIGRVGTDYYGGQIGEVLLFKRALSAYEMKSYYELTRSRYGV